MSGSRNPGKRALAFSTALVLILALVPAFIGTALATHGGENNTTVEVAQVSLVPDSATIPSGGTCVGFTASGTTASGAPAHGETVDIIAQISDDDNTAGSGNEVSDLTISFCDPDGTGAGTALNGSSDVDDAPGNPAESAATIQSECTLDANAQCTFGISVTDASAGAAANSGGSGTVTAFGDQDQGNDLDAGEPRDVSTITVGASGNQAVASIVCSPETQSRSDGGRAEFNCTATNSAGQGLSGIQLTVDVTAGPNAEEVNGANCGATTGPNGATTTSPSTFNGTQAGATPGACGYNDTIGPTSLPGTDTVVICVQQQPSPGQAATQGCDAFEVQDSVTVNWVGAASKITCTPDGANATPGTTVAGSCQVTDVNNLPSGAGVAVTVTEAGPGSINITSNGGNCTPNTAGCSLTNASGQVTFTSTTASNETGLQTITGTLGSSAQGTAGSGATNCSGTTAGQPNTGAPTGTACSDTATINWAQPTQPPPATDCADGSDNDGDGEIDLNDRGCRDASDPTEAGPFASAITLRLRRARPRGFTGQVASSFTRCANQRNVTIFRRGRGAFGSDVTNRDGNYFVRFRGNRGRYQARVARKVITTRSGDEIICLGDRSPVIGVRRNRR